MAIKPSDFFGSYTNNMEEVVIVPWGSNGDGTYNLPAGYTWTDFEYIEMVMGNDNDTVSTFDHLTLPQEGLVANPTSWAVRLTGDNVPGSIQYRLSVVSTGADSFTVADDYSTGSNLRCMKGYRRRVTSRNMSKIINVNGGADVYKGESYTIDIASELGTEYLNRDLIVEVELYNNTGTGIEGWGNTGFTQASVNDTWYSYGAKASVIGSNIELVLGTWLLIQSSSSAPNVWGASTATNTAPCRIKVWKVDQYNPSTTSSGNITTIIQGTFSGGTTMDWSGTGHIISDFDAIIVTGYTAGATSIGGHTSVIYPSSEILGKDVYIANMVSTGATSLARMRIREVTETSCLVQGNNVSYSGSITGLYGINYS